MTSDTPLSPAALKRWLLEELCSYWRARIVDPAGGFFEGLDA
jgi:mannose/cellobiose epimerase-like protein (N-acyl-D-glucosamine 2-epimerase family)